jgi:alcohol dehydrogenase class IV
MTDIDLSFSPRIIIGPFSRIDVGADGWGERALMVADSLLDNEAASIQSQLDASGIAAILFARENLSSEIDILDEVLSLARGSRARFIVALGGEKVMALGRLLAAAAPGTLKARSVMDGLDESCRPLPLLEIPASGRHSLLFRREALLTEPGSRRTVLVALPRQNGSSVFFDPAITSQLPHRASALSMASILSASVEAFLSPRSNFFSDTQASAAVRSAAALLRELKEQLFDPDYRLREVQVSILSSFATGLTTPGPGLLLAWAAAATAGVSKSAAYALMLPRLLESPLYFGSPKMPALARLLADPDDAAAEDAAGAIRTLFGVLRLPGRLRDLGGDLEEVLPASGWAAAMAGFERTDLDEATFRDILELSS